MILILILILIINKTIVCFIYDLFLQQNLRFGEVEAIT